MNSHYINKDKLKRTTAVVENTTQIEDKVFEDKGFQTKHNDLIVIMEKEIAGLKAKIDKVMKQNDALKAKLFNVMRGIILFKTVRAFGFKIDPSLITCCYNFVKTFILKKSLCFPQAGWNACALFVGDF